jgi:hypothetical protein
MFQKTVNTFSAPGIPGDFYDNSPRRVQPGVAATGVEIGKPVFFNAKETDPLSVAGGAAAIVGEGQANFAGIVVNGKELVRKNGLTAGLDVANGTVVSVCTMGRVWIKVTGAVTVGSTIYINDENQYTADSSASGKVEIGKAVIVNSAADGMAVVELG